MSRFKRDNIAGIDYSNTNVVAMIFLIPGLIIQWVLYITGGFALRYTPFRIVTRISRSPIFTYILALISWFFVSFWLFPDQTIVALRAMVEVYDNAVSLFNSIKAETP
jgi:hypothetical protein